MFEEFAAQKLIDTWAGQLAHMNQEAVNVWESAKSAWIDHAQWALATGKEIPPKPQPPAEAYFMTINPDRSIVIAQGPGLVADPTCELPLPVPAPEKPAGVVDIGANYGSIWAAGPKDTTPAGTIVEHKGKTLRKAHSKSPFGETRLYIEVS